MVRRLTISCLAILAFFGPAAHGASTVTAPETDAATQPAPSSDAAKPQVEIFIPSVTTLSDAAAKSKTAELYKAMKELVPHPQNETDEGLDFESLLKLIEQVKAWPDTSVTIAIFNQDREGRARWLLRVDWPVDMLAKRIREILEDQAGKVILKNVEMKTGEGGDFSLELPEMPLAVVRKAGEGSMIASSNDVKMPESVFGMEAVKSAKSGGKKPFLAYCSLNLDAGSEEERGSSGFAAVAGVDSVRYVLSLNKKNEWSEQFGVTWNPVLGMVLKVFFQKVKVPHDCPNEAYVTAVFNSGSGDGMAAMVSGLPAGAIRGRIDSEIMFAAVPGSGFLPIPDQYYVLRAKKQEQIVESIREAIKKENKERAEDDRLPRWHEDRIDGRIVFWSDPAADAYGLMPYTIRSVVYFDKLEDGEIAEDANLIICHTTTWADDAVRRWSEVSKDTYKLPVSKKVHWQGRINWRRAYILAQPYLGLLAGFLGSPGMPPDVDGLDDALADSDVRVQVTLGGIRVKHTGPIPIGAVYVPAVAGVALSASADYSSEVAREQTACRNLRVLYHHAKLFKKDYGRWPATVAELDGYVDFASHWDLLYLRSRDRSLGEGLVRAMFGGAKKHPAVASDNEDEEKAFDDSLYVITWSESDDEWRLMFRDDEFANYENIYIDASGEIHRIPKPAASAAAPTAEPKAKTESSKKSETKKKENDKEKKPKEKKEDKPKPKAKKKVLL